MVASAHFSSSQGSEPREAQLAYYVHLNVSHSMCKFLLLFLAPWCIVFLTRDRLMQSVSRASSSLEHRAASNSFEGARAHI